jgi:hypothetical protein
MTPRSSQAAMSLLVIALVRYGVDLLDAQHLARGAGRLCQKAQIAARVCHILLDDQLVPGIDRDLCVIAHADLGLGRHAARIGIGERHLAFALATRSASIALCRSRRSRIRAIFAVSTLRGGRHLPPGFGVIGTVKRARYSPTRSSACLIHPASFWRVKLLAAVSLP